MDPTSKTGEPRKSRVFLIDDHPLVREGLVNLINSQRDLVVCGEAEDSAGAMTGIAKTRPDVALVDISLKNESGLELVKNLESQFPLVAMIAAICGMPVALITALLRKTRPKSSVSGKTSSCKGRKTPPESTR